LNVDSWILGADQVCFYDWIEPIYYMAENQVFV